MVRCSIKGCKSDGERKISGLSFHSFPDVPELRNLWIATTKRINWVPRRSSKICSKHFDKKNLWKKGKKTFINPDAVPNKFSDSETPNIDVPIKVENDETMCLEKSSTECLEVLVDSRSIVTTSVTLEVKKDITNSNIVKRAEEVETISDSETPNIDEPMKLENYETVWLEKSSTECLEELVDSRSIVTTYVTSEVKKEITNSNIVKRAEEVETISDSETPNIDEPIKVENDETVCLEKSSTECLEELVDSLDSRNIVTTFVTSEIKKEITNTNSVERAEKVEILEELGIFKSTTSNSKTSLAKQKYIPQAAKTGDGQEYSPRTLMRKWKQSEAKATARLKKLKAVREKSRRLTKKVANLEKMIAELKAKSLISEENRVCIL